MDSMHKSGRTPQEILQRLQGATAKRQDHFDTIFVVCLCTQLSNSLESETYKFSLFGASRGLLGAWVIQLGVVVRPPGIFSGRPRARLGLRMQLHRLCVGVY